jgi:hypothetical protein
MNFQCSGRAVRVVVGRLADLGRPASSGETHPAGAFVILKRIAIKCNKLYHIMRRTESLLLIALGVASVSGFAYWCSVEVRSYVRSVFGSTTGGGPTDMRPGDLTPPPDPIASALARAAEGKILFNPPPEMKIGRAYRVDVRITKNPKEDIAKALSGSGPATIESIEVLPFMAVKLEGEDFQIKPLTPENQFIGDDHFTPWDFDVKPLTSGDKSLALAVGIRVKLQPNGEESRFYPLFERRIHVKVNIWYSTGTFLASNLQWVVSAMVIPVLALLWRRRQKALEKRAEPRIKPADDTDIARVGR